MSYLPAEMPIEVRLTTYKSLWFDMIFVVGTQGRIVEASNAVWNIGELFNWLEAIIRDAPTACLTVDREGQCDTLWAVNLDRKRLRLTITDEILWPPGIRDPEDGPYIVYLDAVVSKRKLVWEIYWELSRIHRELTRRHSDTPEEIREKDADVNWWRSPEIEAWLDWEKCNHTICIDDPVTGLDRV